MMGPTLMKISSLTGIPSDGKDACWATEYLNDVFDINFDSTSVSNFIQNNMGSEGDPVIDSEQVVSYSCC